VFDKNLQLVNEKEGKDCVRNKIVLFQSKYSLDMNIPFFNVSYTIIDPRLFISKM
jgi:hypothetical protein